MEPTGDVITWGDGSRGQLGCGDVADSSNPLKVEKLHDAGITSAECGSFHMAAVNSKGHVLTWGCGVDGQLGHPFKPTPQQPQHPDAAVPRIVNGVENAISVACGKSHTLALTRDGAIYGWGASVAAQVGFDNQGKPCFIPRRIPNLRCKMVCIAAGELHSAAVAENGMVYTWGWGEKGRLGHGTETTISQPTLVTRLANESVVFAACGAGHTMVMTQEGKLFSWGAGSSGQLGHGSWGNRFRPSRVEFLRDVPVRQISCGSWHSAAITTKAELYCWGCGEAGQLGNGDDDTSDESNQCLPRLVRALLGKECQFVACGTQHTMAIIKNTRYKKPVDQAVLDTYFRADEDRREVALKKCAKLHVERRRKQASLDLDFVQSQVSKSAAEFLAKSLSQKKSRRQNIDKEKRANKSRPVSARTSNSGLSTPTGYQSHKYRSELRENLRNMGLHQTQMPKWGEPAHFVPVPPQSTPSTSRTASALSSVRQILQSSSVSHAERHLQCQEVEVRQQELKHKRERPATAREVLQQRTTYKWKTPSGAGQEKEMRRTYSRPLTARTHTNISADSVSRRSSGSGPSFGANFRPPSVWGNYWKKI